MLTRYRDPWKLYLSGSVWIILYLNGSCLGNWRECMSNICPLRWFLLLDNELYLATLYVFFLLNLGFCEFSYLLTVTLKSQWFSKLAVIFKQNLISLFELHCTNSKKTNWLKGSDLQIICYFMEPSLSCEKSFVTEIKYYTYLSKKDLSGVLFHIQIINPYRPLYVRLVWFQWLVVITYLIEKN